MRVKVNWNNMKMIYKIKKIIMNRKFKKKITKQKSYKKN